jgi:O-antigen ligase
MTLWRPSLFLSKLRRIAWKASATIERWAATPTAVFGLTIGLGLVVPLLMVVSNRSIHATGPICFVLAFVALQYRQGIDFQALRTRATGLLGILLMALTAWSVLSTAWAPDRAWSFLLSARLVGLLLTGWLGFVSIPRLFPPDATRFLALGVAGASYLILIALGLAPLVVKQASLEAQLYIFNRPLDVLVLLCWPAAYWLVQRRRPFAAMALGALLMATVIHSYAGSATFGLFCGGIGLLLAMLAPRTAFWMIAIAVVAAVIGSPTVLPHVNDWLPNSFETLLRSVSARTRGDIWHWFGIAYRAHWLVGYGLDASRMLGRLPEVAAFPPESAEALKYIHPHNAVLQVWVELGLIGAMLLLGLMLALLYRLWRVTARLRPFVLAAFCSGFSIALVSHGAWQEWWLAAIAVTIVWFGVQTGVEQASSAVKS